MLSFVGEYAMATKIQNTLYGPAAVQGVQDVAPLDEEKVPALQGAHALPLSPIFPGAHVQLLSPVASAS